MFLKNPGELAANFAAWKYGEMSIKLQATCPQAISLRIGFDRPWARFHKRYCPWQLAPGEQLQNRLCLKLLYECELWLRSFQTTSSAQLFFGDGIKVNQFITCGR